VSNASPVLDPGATIGILGGGQLGRMLAQAAARLGFKCHVFAPNPESPAFDVVHRVTCADYADTEALDRFASDVDLVTYEFENVPAETAAFLAARVPVRPDPKVLAITQDRLAEKNFVSGLGIATAAFAAADGPADLTAALKEIGLPAVLKTRRFGYDGKGQAMIGEPKSAEAAWRAVGAQPAILEAFVPFTCEVSVVAARTRDGAVECFDVTENEHQNHILKMSRAVSPRRSRANSIMSACLRSRCSCSATAPCWSTRSRRASTIPGIGRLTALRSRNSSSISAPSPVGRSANPSATAASK
jgi:5-(carboxyamino)imidazole ribonucleotide synthase